MAAHTKNIDGFLNDIISALKKSIPRPFILFFWLYMGVLDEGYFRIVLCSQCTL